VNARHAEAALQAVYQSRSWRITWPLRKLMQLLKWLFRLPVRLVTGLLRLPRRAARRLLAKSIAFVLRREGLKHRARRWLYRHPKLEAHLRAFARARGLIHGPATITQHPHETGQEAADTQADENVLTGNDHVAATLTPRARQIYADLKAAIEKNQKEAA
jgi:O-antigen chain-terminating methyltransferase